MKVSESYSKETPYRCPAGKHFSSEANLTCSACEVEKRFLDYPCVTGRHFHCSRYDAGISNCCKPFVIDVPSLLKKKELEEGRVPALEEKVEEITRKLEKFKDLKSDFLRQISTAKTLRSEALAKGEQPQSDPDLTSRIADIPTIDGHITRESASLQEANAALYQCKFSIGSFKTSLSLGEKYERRDKIHARMTELLTEWNDLVGEIIQLRREHGGLDLADGGMNGPGHYPIFPPGFVGKSITRELAPIYFLQPIINIRPREILREREGGK